MASLIDFFNVPIQLSETDDSMDIKDSKQSDSCIMVGLY